MKKKLFISFSGGLTSAYMTCWLLNNLSDKEWETIVIFANTGKEREETLEFVRDCDKHFAFNTIWIEAVTNFEYRKGTTSKVVTFETASRNGEPFESMIQKYGLPNVKFPHCTRELKTVAMTHYVRKVLGWKDYYTAIGIRVDEIDRVNPKYKELKYIYPFVSMIPTTRREVNEFWDKQLFTLNLKSYEGNCDLCFKKTTRKLLTILYENPTFAKWWKYIEKEYESFVPESRSADLPIRMYRNNISIFELCEVAKRPFSKAKDDSINDVTLFSLSDMDISNGCSDSCEPF